MKIHKPRSLFISHGGGPLPLLGDEDHLEMVETLRTISSKLPKPSAILLISAHWEEEIATITSGLSPHLIYDYYGFPQESYEIKYPCAGEVQLANKVAQALSKAGIESELNEFRGFDHGMFVPLKIMYPDAQIPCVQLSLLNSLDPRKHIEIGEALAKIDYENLLIIGSGFSFHNLKAFFQKNNDHHIMNEEFEAWLVDICSNKELDTSQRTNRLIRWEDAPYARFNHPREEHLLPLHVCYGVHETACSEFYEINILRKKSSFFLWQ